MRFDHLKRRQFITLLGGAAAWPVAARAQQAGMQVIGFLNGSSATSFAPMVAGFRQGLSTVGYVESQNVAIEFRWSENQPERLPALAADLVDRHVSAIAATGGLHAVLAAKTATAEIPIVFTSGSDPVRLGITASFNRPRGNLTGVNMLITEIESKRLGLLHELVPAATRVAVMADPNNPDSDIELKDVRAAALAIGVQLDVLHASNEKEIEAGFARIAQIGGQALQVAGAPFFIAQRERFATLAARHHIPAIYEARNYAEAGGLVSYGPNVVDVYRQVGVYVGQILKGARPSDLPVIQPTAIELVINLKTARALGIAFPPSLLATADEVIE
jgi:putative ABC transport system substrate-binding protein